MRHPPEPEEQLAGELPDRVVGGRARCHFKILAQLLRVDNYLCYKLLQHEHHHHDFRSDHDPGEPAQEGTMSAKKATQKSAKSTTAINKKSKGFTDEERAAMKERAQELKAETRRGPRADKADGESA